MKTLFLALCALFAFTCPAPAAEIPATSATIQKAWASAKGGDVVKLSGAFGLTVLPARTFDPPLVVDASGAAFTSIITNSVQGIIWRGGVFAPVDTRPAMQLNAPRGWRIEGITFRGQGQALGIYANNGTDLVVTESEFDRPRNALTSQNMTRVEFSLNSVRGWSFDGVGMQGSSFVTIRGNDFRDPIRTDPNAHMDAIQGYDPAAGQARNTDILIEGNRIKGADTQGVFMPSSDRVTARRNFIALRDAPNGIVVPGPGSEITNNIVTTLPGSKWQVVIQATFPTALRCGNSTDAYSFWKAVVEARC